MFRIVFLYEREHIGRFSNLHQCTFKDHYVLFQPHEFNVETQYRQKENGWENQCGDLAKYLCSVSGVKLECLVTMVGKNIPRRLISHFSEPAHETKCSRMD